MRNVFDQYRHHENRLTHALVSTLSESNDLLKSFAQRAGHPVPPGTKVIQVAEQSCPGQIEASEEEAIEKGLPDAWLDDGADWALVIESKVKAPISIAQLNRHLSLAERRHANARVLLISIEKAPEILSTKFLRLQWTDVYLWAQQLARSHDWAKKLAEYMRVVELQLIAEKTGMNGALTTFSGISFGSENPYSYMEAKRLLRLLMLQLRERKALQTKFGVTLEDAGRSAIKGKVATSVWDFISLGSTGETFTKSPHLTVGIRADEAVAQLTIPNAVRREVRAAIVKGGREGFEQMILAFIRSIEPVLATDPGCQPFVEALQRHYPHRGGMSIEDSCLVFDPRTVVGHGQVKAQPEWLHAVFDAIANRNSNLQIAIGVKFPYGRSTTVSSTEFAKTVSEVFLATQPFFEKISS